MVNYILILRKFIDFNIKIKAHPRYICKFVLDLRRKLSIFISIFKSYLLHLCIKNPNLAVFPLKMGNECKNLENMLYME